MSQLIQVIASGLAIGSIYALIALGIVLLYRTTSILNFAHGEFGLFGTFMAFTFFNSLKLPYPLSFLLSLLAAALLGGIISILLVKPARASFNIGLAILLAALAYGLGVNLIISAAIGIAIAVVSYIFLEQPNRNPSELGLLILTLGVNLFLQGFYSLSFGSDNKILPSIVSNTSIKFAGASVSLGSIFTSLMGLVIMLLLWLLLNHSKIGLAMRALAQREDVAKAMGIPVRLVSFATWATSAALAGAAALLLAPSTLLSPSLLLDPVSKGFVAAVIGGMNSLPGAIVGGYILGLLELFVGVYISNELKASLAFIIVILVLILKPHGLLGKPEIKRV